MIQIGLIVLGVVLFLMGLKGITQEGIWITSEKQLEGSAVKILGVLVILGGVALVGYALFVLPRL